MLETKIITRKSGTQVKIVAELFTSVGCINPMIENRVFHRNHDKDEWVLCNNRSSVVTNSVDEFVDKGRIEMFKFVTYSELLGVNSDLLKKCV